MVLNRAFVARIIIAIYFLTINALPFYGDKSSEGKLSNLLRILSVFNEGVIYEEAIYEEVTIMSFL